MGAVGDVAALWWTVSSSNVASDRRLRRVHRDELVLECERGDVMGDGRFIGAVWRSGTAEGQGSDIVVVLNWLSELKTRVPRP